jgi:hypothetical protein
MLNGVVEGRGQEHGHHCGGEHYIRGTYQGAPAGTSQEAAGPEDQEYKPGGRKKHSKTVEYRIGYFFTGSLKRQGLRKAARLSILL